VGERRACRLGRSQPDASKAVSSEDPPAFLAGADARDQQSIGVLRLAPVAPTSGRSGVLRLTPVNPSSGRSGVLRLAPVNPPSGRSGVSRLAPVAPTSGRSGVLRLAPMNPPSGRPRRRGKPGAEASRAPSAMFSPAHQPDCAPTQEPRPCHPTLRSPSLQAWGLQRTMALKRTLWGTETTTVPREHRRLWPRGPIRTH